ncbi:MAG TPA: BadF/BadG/BcrA/BcrD ATPase family protein [Candidatus Acidoferrum sp.]|jgi:N-acetylglucosamine kinase-like BadF-type ATPase|nr:BadF/BadG/BcrA/BcrD ATPase family protein [Candidatus Acidoferrum sp.]
MRFGLRWPPRCPAKCDENSGCLAVRQESNPRYVRCRNAFGTAAVFTFPKISPLAYAFSMRYVLGLDGGGTKTECVLMDESCHVVTSSRGGPSNPMRVGFGGALAAVCEAARIAISAAKISNDAVVSLCAGLAGTAYPESGRKMRRLLEEEFPGKLVRVCTDMDLTLEAIGSGPAIVLIAGTGSAAVGRDAQGHTARVGGHGYLLGDEGSAYHVGQRAVLEALRHFERTGADSSMGKKILSEIGAPTWADLQSRVYAAPDEVFPRLFPTVLQVAEAGEATARSLLDDCAAALAELVSDLAGRLQLQSQNFLLASTGGMLGRSAGFDECLDVHLRKAAPRAQFSALQLSPAEAAAHLALQLLPPA